MKPLINQPPQVDWLTGAFAQSNIRYNATRMADLAGIFADAGAWLQCDPQQTVYEVGVLASPTGEGELFAGVTHLRPGKVGNEFFMTRGHFHARREQGEVYFGLRGKGLLLLQPQCGKARLEWVGPGSVHIIPGYTAHRLINVGADVLTALAVWPTTAGHDYAALAQGFSLRVNEGDREIQICEVNHG